MSTTALSVLNKSEHMPKLVIHLKILLNACKQLLFMLWAKYEQVLKLVSTFENPTLMLTSFYYLPSNINILYLNYALPIPLTSHLKQYSLEPITKQDKWQSSRKKQTKPIVWKHAMSNYKQLRAFRAELNLKSWNTFSSSVSGLCVNAMHISHGDIETQNWTIKQMLQERNILVNKTMTTKHLPQSNDNKTLSTKRWQQNTVNKTMTTEHRHQNNDNKMSQNNKIRKDPSSTNNRYFF